MKDESKNTKKRNKFKVGDKVLLLDNLTLGYLVVNVFIEEQVSPIGLDTTTKEEMVVLNNEKVYNAKKLTHYSEPIQLLARKIEELQSKEIKKDNKKNNTSREEDDLVSKWYACIKKIDEQNES